MQVFLAIVCFSVIIPVLWMLAASVGALFGWLTVAFLSLIFTFDYEAMRQVGLVVGAISGVHLSSSVKS